MFESRTKILLIEDNLGDARLFSEYLLDSRGFDYETDHAFTLASALLKLREKEYDVILLDLGLPDSQGLAGLEKIFQKNSSVPVIVLTGLEDESLAVNAVKMGAQDYLVKIQADSHLLVKSIRYAIERKKTQQRLRESEDHYRSLFENNRSVMLLINCDTGYIEDVNSAALDFYGYNREECLKLHISEINTSPKEVIMDKLRIAFLRENNHFQFRHRLKNGEIRDVEVYSGPVCKGNKKLLYSIVHDISERIKAENALKVSENRYKALAHSATDAIISADQTGRIISWNKSAEKIFGYSEEEILGRPVIVLMPEELHKMHYMRFRDLSSGDTSKLIGHTLELQAIRKDGSMFPIELSLASWKTGEGNFFSAIIRDITRRKRSEEEIRKSLEREKELNELKSRFVSMVSHEYRTPLTSILSSTELLELFGHKWSEEKKQEHLSKIKRSVNYMTEMLGDVLLINRAEAGKLEYNPEEIDLVSLCRELVRDIQASTGAKCNLTFISNESSYYALMDKKLLRYIFNNLLLNAVNYSPASSEIIFGLDTDGLNAEFRISDKGIGIPEDDHARLFEPFYRGKNISNVPGTGLGLSIVKRCVDMHKGQISFKSIQSRGTTFTVILPALKVNRQEKTILNEIV
ncbi:MAG: PAS domain S-box protein [Bacillota bacterium]